MPSLDRAPSTFPGPRVAGVACILAPFLLGAGAFLLHPTDASVESHLLSYQPDASRASLGINAFMAGVVAAALAGIALAQSVARRARVLGALGGFLIVAWAATAAFFGGVMWLDVASTRATGAATPEAVATAAGMMPIPAMLGTLGLLLGWGVLALGAWRASVLPLARAIALAAVCLVPVAIAYAGQPLVALVPFFGMGVALVPMGLQLIRDPTGASPRADDRASA